MLSANFKPKRTAAASRGFLATARLSCFMMLQDDGDGAGAVDHFDLSQRRFTIPIPPGGVV